MIQLSNELKTELHKEATANGFNDTEYRILLGMVDRLLTEQTMKTVENVHGTAPTDEYDIEGNLLNN